MGELIVLTERRDPGLCARPAARSRPAFYFDLDCPFSYLAAERVERALGDVEWVPTPATALGSGTRLAPPARAQAEHRAAELRLPLVWPAGLDAGSPSALRAASYAAEVGAGARFALAASRLAFCGGFELRDPAILAEAAAAAGIGLEACLLAAADPARDGELHAAGRELLGLGVRRLPAVRVGSRCLQGELALGAAAALVQAGLARNPPGRGPPWRGRPVARALAPVG
jgi:2-hydroxychromene-2-carboxylate isomerase